MKGRLSYLHCHLGSNPGPPLEVRGDRGARCDGGGDGGAGHQDGAPAGGAGLSVANGAVSVERPESPSAASLVKYKVTLRAYNPSGRAVVHFGGDNLVRLIYGAAAWTLLAASTLPAFVVPQQESHFVTKSAFLNASALPASLAARLYDGETDQVVVQAVASLSFTIGGARGVSAGKRGHNFTFHCWPVSISSYYEVSGGEASCSQDTTQAAVAGLTHDRCIGGPCPEPYKNSGNCSGNSTGTGSKG